MSVLSTVRQWLGSVSVGFTNKTPVSYAATGGLGRVLIHGDDRTSQLKAMGSVGTLFAIVNRKSTAVAGVDWNLWRTRDGRGRITGDEPRREVASHLALDVLDNPNDFMSRQELFEVTEQHMSLVGEGYWLISRNPAMDVPLELWPIRPDRMEPVPHPTDFLSGWVYSGPNGEKVPLDIDEVIQFKTPNPLDPYRGLGPVQAILVDLDSARYSAEWNRNFFVNSAEPGGIIEFEDGLDDDEFRQFRARWREQHQGVAQAHRVALIERGGHWKDRAFSMRDMQFAQLRDVSRDIIREAFGMSKTMLGQTEDVNRATAEAAEYVFSRWVLGAALERYKGGLNRKFLPMFGTTGQGVEFDFEDPTPESAEQVNADRDSRVSAAVNLVNAGWDPDEVLETVGLPPMSFIGKPVSAEPTLDQGQPEPAPSTNGNRAKERVS